MCCLPKGGGVPGRAMRVRGRKRVPADATAITGSGARHAPATAHARPDAAGAPPAELDEAADALAARAATAPWTPSAALMVPPWCRRANQESPRSRCAHSATPSDRRPHRPIRAGDAWAAGRSSRSATPSAAGRPAGPCGRLLQQRAPLQASHAASQAVLPPRTASGSRRGSRNRGSWWGAHDRPPSPATTTPQQTQRAASSGGGPHNTCCCQPLLLLLRRSQDSSRAAGTSAPQTRGAFTSAWSQRGCVPCSARFCGSRL
mmetsp:Transcript_16293/g.61794  ORF Transcript_16293/g.61794 Transcript_16293/m.61794 type:complete len:261 (+) Transcript_16293:529-1311(+)